MPFCSRSREVERKRNGRHKLVIIKRSYLTLLPMLQIIARVKLCITVKKTVGKCLTIKANLIVSSDLFR